MNNYMRYRGLFAVELALLPLMIAFKLIIDSWAVCIPLLMLAACRVIMIFIKNKASLGDYIIESVGDGVILAFISIFFAVTGYIPAWLAVMICILVPLYELSKVYFYSKPMNDVIEALDFCFLAFIFTSLISLSFVTVSDVIAKVSLIAIMLTMAVVIIYKLYRFFRYYIIDRKSKFAKQQAKAKKKK